MIPTGIVVRPAVDADLRPLHDLCRKVWKQLEIPFDVDFAHFQRLEAQGFRVVVLYEGDAMMAGLIAHPVETDRGPGYEITALAVDQDAEDRVLLLDALAFYASNAALSEGRPIVIAPRRRAPTMYGRDMLGMNADLGDDAEAYQVGDAAEHLRRILERRPEWRASL